MAEVTTQNKPFWVKVLFEMPEFIMESLLKGVFPNTRKTIIDISTDILVYCGKRRKRLQNFFEWVENTTILVIEWINNNWKKKIET